VFSGQKPVVPDDMPDDLQQLMKECWRTEPGSRPTFKSIYDRLKDMLARALASNPILG
jgi:hypothetical protein